MKFGYVKETSGITKTINLSNIKNVIVTEDSIEINYFLSASLNFNDRIYLISFINAAPISVDLIKAKFYSWLQNALVSTSPLSSTLNAALPQLEFVSAGLINGSGIINATFESAVDEPTACAIVNPTKDCILETKDSVPAPGTLILEKISNDNYNPLPDGGYALKILTNFFITVSGSRIVTINPCPLQLDFVFDPNQQASGVVDNANYFSLATISTGAFAPGTPTVIGNDFPNYYGANTPGAFFGSLFNISLQCTIYPVELKSANDRTWPCGYVVNGFLGAPEGLGQLPAFAIQLADTNVADFVNAKIFVSNDYYVTGDKDQATWVLFDQNYYTQGIPGFGNGTQFAAGTIATVDNIIRSVGIVSGPGLQGSSRAFVPAGSSLVTPTTTFTGDIYINFLNGEVFAQNTCP
tara:strand:- start:536 stop:1765 length:1230 start_codon:yes stop_codon:yes gene_type:complete